MSESYIRIQRFPYEEPYHLQLGLEASNGVFQGGFDFYTNTDVLCDLGSRLNFPSSITDEVSWTDGSDRPEDRCYRYLAEIGRMRRGQIVPSRHSIRDEREFTKDTREGRCRFFDCCRSGFDQSRQELLIRFCRAKASGTLLDSQRWCTPFHAPKVLRLSPAKSIHGRDRRASTSPERGEEFPYFVPPSTSRARFSEAGEFLEKGEGDIADGAVALFGEDEG